MIIQILGLGVLGTAQAFLCQKLGHEVFGFDKRQLRLHPYCQLLDKLERNVDLTFICTPEGKVPKVIKQLISIGTEGLIAVRSTLPVGQTRKIRRKIHVCHNPEFLREKHALYDVMNPSRIVIGECCREHGDVLENFYKPLNRPIYRVDPTTSELVKLVSNALRSVNISFWNELALLCEKVDANVQKVAEVANPAKVLGDWEGGKWGTKFFCEPYDGKCLPKDTQHLIEAFHQANLNPEILEATEHFNNWLKKKVRKG